MGDLTYSINCLSKRIMWRPGTELTSISCCCFQLLSHVQLFVAPWSVAHQASLPRGFPRQEHWSGLPRPYPGDLPDPDCFCICSSDRQVLYHWATREAILFSVQFSSVTHLWPTLCDPMDCSRPGFPVHHQLPELLKLISISQWYHPTISFSIIGFSSHHQSFLASRIFLVSQFFASGGQSIGVSASTSVFPVNIGKYWFPLGWTGWILQCKELSRVFSNTTVWKHQSFSAHLSL